MTTPLTLENLSYGDGAYTSPRAAVVGSVAAIERMDIIQILNAVPTALSALSTKELAEYACVSRVFREEITVECAIQIGIQASDLFKQFFHADPSIIDFFNRYHLEIVNCDNLLEVHSAGKYKRFTMKSFLIKLNQEKFNELKKLFVGIRLPVGLENIFQEVEEYHERQQRQAALRNDPEIVMAAVGQNPVALEYVPEEVLANQDLVWQAVAMYGAGRI
jgi:hypothetical protein